MPPLKDTKFESNSQREKLQTSSLRCKGKKKNRERGKNASFFYAVFSFCATPYIGAFAAISRCRFSFSWFA